jgi:preprotein translocase subunit YajC
MFITPAHAQSLFGGDASSTLVQVAPLALIFVVFYFFLIRPQQQKAKQQKAMLNSIRRGDRIVTGGGLLGTVSKVMGNEELQVDLAEGVRVRVVRSTVASVLSRTEPAPSKGGKDDDDDDDDADSSGDKAKAGGKAR